MQGELQDLISYYTDKSNCIILSLFLLFSITITGLSDEYPEAEEAEEKEYSNITYGAEIAFASQYIWRGIELSDGVVLEPAAWIQAYGLYFEVWGNFFLEDADQGEPNEIDLISYYELVWNNFTLEPGFEAFLYPDADEPSTLELTIGLSYSILDQFSIFTKHYFDVAEYQGSYFGTVGVGFERELESLPFYIDSSLKLGWGNSDFNEVNIEVSKSALNVIIADLSVYYYPLDHLYIRPHIQFSALLDDDLRDAVDNPTIVSGGIAVGVEF